MSTTKDEKPEVKEKHLVDFVYMKGPETAPGADDGEVLKVSTSGMAISRKMFAGYRQVETTKGDKE